MNPELQVLIDALPESGTMAYEEWKNTLPPSHWRYIQDARRGGNVVFSIARDENGNPVHVVGRGE